jgi:hypothetical protein
MATMACVVHFALRYQLLICSTTHVQQPCTLSHLDVFCNLQTKF